MGMQMNKDTGSVRFNDLPWTGSSEVNDDYGLAELIFADTDQIGVSQYYISSEYQDLVLWKRSFDQSRVEFHERMAFEDYGITEEDLVDAIRMCRLSSGQAGIWPISGHIAQKLRIIELL
jgi:hypothetical protein